MPILNPLLCKGLFVLFKPVSKLSILGTMTELFSVVGMFSFSLAETLKTYGFILSPYKHALMQPENQKIRQHTIHTNDSENILQKSIV